MGCTITLDENISDNLKLDAGDYKNQFDKVDVGITGVDYAIAETGSCILFASNMVSRAISLMPEIHICIVEKSQIVPDLDVVFAIYRDFILNQSSKYFNIMTGPSRSADIEQTLVTGVHGPGEVHMVLIK